MTYLGRTRIRRNSHARHVSNHLYIQFSRVRVWWESSNSSSLLDMIWSAPIKCAFLKKLNSQFPRLRARQKLVTTSEPLRAQQAHVLDVLIHNVSWLFPQYFLVYCAAWSQTARLLHSSGLTAVGLLVEYETRPSISWYHDFGIGWCKYKWHRLSQKGLWAHMSGKSSHRF